MEKVYITMVFEIILQKGIEKTRSFDFNLRNGNIFVKTVCAIRKYNKISPELF